MDVFCIGNLNYDISFHVSRLPDMHEKIRCDDAFFSCGGSAGNTACWLGSLGFETGMVGAVGEDPLGYLQLQDLASYHVKTETVRRTGATGIAVILVEGEAKRMIKFTGANQWISVDESIRCARHIHVSSCPLTIVKEIIAICRDVPLTLSWDPQELLFTELVPHVTYLFINEDDLRRKIGTTPLKEARDVLPAQCLVVTRNGGGCSILTHDTIDIPPFGYAAVDSTGAGDAFDAGFISGLLTQHTLKECGILGTAASTMKVQHRGARGGICRRDDFNAFLRKHDLTITL
ncbi:MAG: carbohydrate kinase family protein [Theionarchaea archaeon]|nr:carbohydrate kinase family protein [Theionarchaea archaeon]MBU6999286.1 carbohydrate kinase family protein [Theionarchaea archaeon]MBU7019589.1 carbohydrate kinase family protein [Theionarchaea archaeon]MBU7033768.1 carbohydrate kinase family protein [Theionarchaea archaeon]MBU7039422.1 carbohydrate kinase family protein [Theionarchaea archaeon]